MGEIYAGLPSAGRRVQRLTALVHQTFAHACAVRVPYKPGEAVIGDDPFNGRREGVVSVVNGAFVGIRTGDQTSFYDYRQVRRLD